jgi:hypothetical protein
MCKGNTALTNGRTLIMAANIPVPYLTNVLGERLPGNEISVAENSAGVDVKVETDNLAAGTRVFAFFGVPTQWSQEKTVEKQGVALTFRVEVGLYNHHIGKEATFKCKYNQVDSPELKARIVP